MAIENDATLLQMLLAVGALEATVGVATITGVLDAVHSLVEDVDTTSPVFVCRSSDVAALAITYGSTLTIGAAEFVVRGIQPDGVLSQAGVQSGLTQLVLEAA